jgi:hypothetical protein
VSDPFLADFDEFLRFYNLPARDPAKGEGDHAVAEALARALADDEAFVSTGGAPATVRLEDGVILADVTWSAIRHGVMQEKLFDADLSVTFLVERVAERELLIERRVRPGAPVIVYNILTGSSVGRRHHHCVQVQLQGDHVKAATAEWISRTGVPDRPRSCVWPVPRAGGRIVAFCPGTGKALVGSGIADVWLEAEHAILNSSEGALLPEGLQPDDALTGKSSASDAIVRFADGRRFVGSFLTFEEIDSARRCDQRSGKRLSGSYFWTSDMILIEKVTRGLIEQVVVELIAKGAFEHAFSQCEQCE